MMERRWIILDSFGNHAAVGRHSDPSDAELDAAAVTLASMGRGGWLAVLEGSYYSALPVTLRWVADLVPAAAQFSEAVQMFHAARQAVAA